LQGDIAASYSGQVPENTLPEENLKDKQAIADSVVANGKLMPYSKDPADLGTINEKVLKVCPINEQAIKQ